MLALPFEKVPWRLTPFEEIVTVIPFGRPAQLIIKDPDEYEGSERVERSIVAHLDLAFHILENLVHRHVTGTFDDRLNAAVAGDFSEFAERIEFRELRLVIRIRDGARAEAVAERDADVIFRKDFANFAEMRIKEIFLLVHHAPARENGTAAGNDARGARERERHVIEQKSRVNGEIIDALFRLFDERIAEHFPGEIVGDAVHLFERLVDRHGSDRHGTVAQNPFAGLVDVLPRRKIHHGVRAETHGPDH